MRKSNAPVGSKQRRTLALVAAPPPVVSRDQRKSAGQLPLWQATTTSRSAHLGVLLPPTGDSAAQGRSIFQAAEPSVFVPACENEKSVEGRSPACNVSVSSPNPVPVEKMSEEVSLSTGRELNTHIKNMDRRRLAEQKSLDYQQSLLQQYEKQKRVPQDDEKHSIKQRESNKLGDRISSVTASHNQPIPAGESAVDGHAAATRPSSPSFPNIQQTIARQPTHHHRSDHHPAVDPVNVSALSTNEPHASNEESLRAQLVQRDQEIADIMDRLTQSEDAQCVMAAAEVETSSRLTKELSRLQSELNFKSHSIQDTERELKRMKRDMAGVSLEAEKAIAAKDEALRMAEEARKILLERTESKSTITTHLKPVVLQQQSQKIGSGKVNNKHRGVIDHSTMTPMTTHRVPYSGYSPPQLQMSTSGASITSTFHFQPLLSFLGGDGASDILSLYSAAPYGTVGPFIPAEDGNHNSTSLMVNTGSLSNSSSQSFSSKVNRKERLQILPKRLNECLLDIQSGRQGGSALVIVLGEYLSVLGTEIQVTRLLQSVLRLLTGVLGLCSEACALVLSVDGTISTSSLQNTQHQLRSSSSSSQNSSLLETQCGGDADSGETALQVDEEVEEDTWKHSAPPGYAYLMHGVGTTDTGSAATTGSAANGRASILDLAEDLCNTLLACLQEASAVQLEAWEPLCDGMSFHFAFFAKSSSPRLKEQAMELLRCLMQSKKLFSLISSCSTAAPSTCEAIDGGHAVCGNNIPTHSISSPSSNLPLLRHLCNISFSFQPGSVQPPLRSTSLGLYLRLIRLCSLLCVRYEKDAFNHLLRDDKESGFTPTHLLPKLVNFIRVELEGWERVRDRNILSPYVLSWKEKAVHQTRSTIIRESFQLLVRLVQNSPRPLRETVVAAGMHDSLLALVDKLYNGASFESLNVVLEAKSVVLNTTITPSPHTG